MGRAWWQPKRWAVVAVPGLALLSLSATAQAVSGIPAASAVGQAHRVFTGSDLLSSVAATGAGNAWAVGDYFVTRSGRQFPLIEHWNGRRWRVAPSPAVGTAGGYLAAVTALSAKNAWTVGSAHGKALIEHWSGTAWHVVTAARLRGKVFSSTLSGVAAISARSAWTVGSLSTGRGLVPLIEHWNGARWTRMASPDPGGPAAGDFLTGVTASKAGVWAVGASAPHNVYRTIVLALVHGTWRQQHSPNPSGLGNWLGAVSAAGRRVLAAGFGGYDNPVAAQTLVLHRAASAFRLDSTPNPGSQDELYGVAATASGGWAVGRSAAQTLTLREVSGQWQQVPSPSWQSPATSILEGVTTWRKTAWAVGQYSVDVGPISVSYSLILRWTGTAWTKVPSPNR